MTKTRNITLHVGVIGGTRLPINVENFLGNLETLLSKSDIDLRFELLLAEHVEHNLNEYQIVSPGFGHTERAGDAFQVLLGGITRYAKSRSPDLLFQVTEFPLHGSATAIAGFRTNTPVLTRFSGDSFREYHYTSGKTDKIKTFILNNVLGRIATRLSTGTIVLGPNSRNEILRRNQNTSVWTVPQPTLDSRFLPVSERRKMALREKIGLPKENRILLTVGRLTHRKGIDDLIRVASNLSPEEITWCVVGDGNLRSEVELIDTTQAIGRVPYQEIHQYFQLADLVVHPSRIEGLPNVLLEAAACGVPSIARDVGDCYLAASRTFQNVTDLKEIVHREYKPVPLGPQFSSDTLREMYTEALLSVSGIGN